MATLMVYRICLRSYPSLPPPATRTLESMATMLVSQVLLESPHRITDGAQTHCDRGPEMYIFTKEGRLCLLLLGQPPPSLRAICPDREYKKTQTVASGNLPSKEGKWEPGRHVGPLTFGGHVKHGSSTAGSGSCEEAIAEEKQGPCYPRSELVLI